MVFTAEFLQLFAEFLLDRVQRAVGLSVTGSDADGHFSIATTALFKT
jgi:hypothetical protein